MSFEPIINPYAGVDWDTYYQLHSSTHVHDGQKSLQDSYAQGIRHYAPSQYQPSRPWYPLAENYNSVPEDLLGAPNSEKVKTSNRGGHFNALGSLYASPGHKWDTDVDGPYLTWQEKFDSILAELLFPDGGGVVLNHPHDMNVALRSAQLDYDERVLGIEIYTNLSEHKWGEGYHYHGYHYRTFVPLWDRILRTGRRCWGFCTTDHMTEETEPWYGRNVLLVPSITEENALRAYRMGAFVGVIMNTGLMFTSIEAVDDTINVEVNDERATIRLITGVRREEVIGDTAQFTIDEYDVYARFEVESDGERIFSQPLLYPYSELPGNESDKRRRRRKIATVVLL